MTKNLNIGFLRWLPLLALLALGLAPRAVQAQRDPDLNRDGNPDLIWQNNYTGDLVVWYMNGANWTGSYDFIAQAIPTEWKVVATVDLNQTGNSDLIWQNNSTGDVVIWYMNGASWTGNYDFIAQGIPTEWKIVGAADLNHDRSIDLIWQNNRTGDVVVWYMNGPSWTGSYDFIAQGIPTEWKIAGTADMNRDGSSDLIWQNRSTGDVVVWYMNGPSWTGSYDFIAQGIPTEWKVVGTSHVGSNVNADLIWQNNRTGDVVVWYMNGPSWTGNYDFIAQGIPTEWKIARPH